MVVNSDCQLGLIEDYQVDTPLVMPVREFLDWINQNEETHPKYAWQFFMGWGPGLTEKEPANWVPVIIPLHFLSVGTV